MRICVPQGQVKKGDMRHSASPPVPRSRHGRCIGDLPPRRPVWVDGRWNRILQLWRLFALQDALSNLSQHFQICSSAPNDFYNKRCPKRSRWEGGAGSEALNLRLSQLASPRFLSNMLSCQPVLHTWRKVGKRGPSSGVLLLFEARYPFHLRGSQKHTHTQKGQSMPGMLWNRAGDLGRCPRAPFSIQPPPPSPLPPRRSN